MGGNGVMVKILSSNTFAQRTGRYRFRTSFTGKLILQLEWMHYDDESGKNILSWQDAKLTDIDMMESEVKA
jgi:hypothetical protein